MFPLFWIYYPIGTRLTWRFAIRQMNEVRVFFTDSMFTVVMAYIMILKTWPVFAVPFLKDLPNLLRRTCPFEKGAGRVVFAISFWIIAVSALAPVLTLISTITIALLAAIAVLGSAALLISWPVLFAGFFAWLLLYRLPVYEFILPRIIKWMLRHNTRVYHDLPKRDDDGAYIRAVRIKAGSGKQPLVCELVVGKLGEFSYEALSYCWGVTLLPYKISVNDQPFYVTANLRSALHGLRWPDRNRIVWVDAMAINQFDPVEKGEQVQLMHTIYSKASQVVVFLGEGSSSTPEAFDIMKQFSAEEDKASNWRSQLASPQWKRSRREFISLARQEWWQRAWIIQEVVAGQHVIVQRADCTITWDELYAFFNYEPFHETFMDAWRFPEPILGFARNVQELRLRAANPEAAKRSTLLDLVFGFRFQAATFGSDQIYALLGLLREDEPTRLIPDYKMSVEDVYLEFTLSCLKHNKDLVILALAPGAEMMGASWCRDWRFQGDGQYPVLWFSRRNLSDYQKMYSASGGHPVVYNHDPAKPLVLSIQGYSADTITELGDFWHERANTTRQRSFFLQSWERTAKGPWLDDPEMQRAFCRTITADWLSEDLTDWRTKLEGKHAGAPEKDESKYAEILEDVCLNRRFFTTKDGRFGIGPWNMKKTDEVCILLGGSTPFIMRRSREGFKIIGEAYVDGLMYYTGDIRQDIASGALILSEYILT